MKNSDLKNHKCVPCEGGVDPMKRSEFEQYLDQVIGWSIREDKKLEKEFKFKNFKEALLFINKVGAIAEEEGHHPDINLHNWNRVTLTLSTHAIGGLSLNDFIVGRKINWLFEGKNL